MSSGGFWPGESPGPEEEDVQEPLGARTPDGEPLQPEPELEPGRAPAPPAESESAEPEPEPWPPFSEEAQESSPGRESEPPAMTEPEAEPAPPTFEPPVMPEPESPREPESPPEPPVMSPPEPPLTPEPKPELQEPIAEPESQSELVRVEPPAVHAPGELDIPDDIALLEGSPSGADRTIGIVVARFNGEVSNRLLASALEALEAAGVSQSSITVMPVPGAFELPIGAMALAKTRRYSCVIALGCVIRGETAHFEYIASEAASGLQLAGLETGVPVAFGVLTVDRIEQAEERTDKGADAARAALEMADLFAQLRASARS